MFKLIPLAAALLAATPAAAQTAPVGTWKNCVFTLNQRIATTGGEEASQVREFKYTLVVRADGQFTATGNVHSARDPLYFGGFTAAGSWKASVGKLSLDGVWDSRTGRGFPFRIDLNLGADGGVGNPPHTLSGSTQSATASCG